MWYYTDLNWLVCYQKQITLSLCSYYPWLWRKWASLTKSFYMHMYIIIFSQATRVCDMRGAISSKYRGRLIVFYQTKDDKHISYVFSFLVSQYFYIPKISILLFITNELPNFITHDNSGSINIVIIINYNAPMLNCNHITFIQGDHITRNISARRPAILAEVFCGFPQSLVANAGIVP
jgi:hypothetical protein